MHSDTQHLQDITLRTPLPNGRALSITFKRLRTVTDSCKRLRTRKHRHANNALPLRLPKRNENN